MQMGMYGMPQLPATQTSMVMFPGQNQADLVKAQQWNVQIAQQVAAQRNSFSNEYTTAAVGSYAQRAEANQRFFNPGPTQHWQVLNGTSATYKFGVQQHPSSGGGSFSGGAGSQSGGGGGGFGGQGGKQQDQKK